jgi:hypothetical protein
MITNILISCEGRLKFKERYLLPNFRQVYDALVKVGQELEVEPIIITDDDGYWWNDDVLFMLDRMCYEINANDELKYEWRDDILSKPWKAGEVRVYQGANGRLVATADESLMVGGKIDMKQIDAVGGNPIRR